jgi:molybdopterin-guanine dinucleotide biosynthesis adapter protein
MRTTCPVIGLVAAGGTGKTTLLIQLIPLLRERGLRVGLVERACPMFDPDGPGKDGYKLRKAGASKVLVGSDQRWALVVENEQPTEPRLPDMLHELRADDLDLVLVEGFEATAIPRIEVHRAGRGHPLLAPIDRNIVAIATDAPDLTSIGVPVLNLDDPEAIAEFIVGRFMAPRTRTANADVPAWLIEGRY